MVIGAVVTVGMLGVGILTLREGIADWMLRRRLQRQGRSVSGVVTGVHRMARVTYRPPADDYTISFADDRGQTLVVQRSTTRRLDAGDAVPLRYLDDDPLTTTTLGAASVAPAVFVSLGGALLLTVGLALAFLLLVAVGLIAG